MERPKLKRDWVGLIVETLRPLRTKGGNSFRAGTRMLVRYNHGGLHLEAMRVCKKCQLEHYHCINGVSERDVMIVGRQ